MAIITWNGNDPGNEGDLGTAANWLGGTLPVAGDTILFTDQSSTSVTSGFADLSSTALTGSLLDCTVTDGYLGDLGASGSEIDIGLTGALNWAGQGTAHFISNASNHALVVSNSRQNETGKGLFISQDATRLVVNRGRVEVLAASTINDVVSHYTSSKDSDTVLQVRNGATITNMEAMFGTVWFDAAVTNLMIGEAKVRYGRDAAPTMTTLKMYCAAGRLDWRQGPIVVADLFAGELMWANSGAARTMTFGRFYNRFNDNEILSQGAVNQVTVTNPTEFKVAALTTSLSAIT